VRADPGRFRRLPMSEDSRAVAGVLDADGITIRLASRITLPPGMVSVVVSPLKSSAPAPKSKQPAGLLTSEGKPTAHYAAYLRYQEKYAKAKRDFEEAYARVMVNPALLHQWPFTGVGFQAAVDSAWQEWVTLGFKNEIEKKLAGDK
jgi:hypothetical protein